MVHDESSKVLLDIFGGIYLCFYFFLEMLSNASDYVVFTVARVSSM